MLQMFESQSEQRTLHASFKLLPGNLPERPRDGLSFWTPMKVCGASMVRDEFDCLIGYSSPYQDELLEMLMPPQLPAGMVTCSSSIRLFSGLGGAP